MEKNDFAYLFKFVIIGESGVGKSCLVLNFTEQKPRRQHQVTIACEFASRVIDIREQSIKVQIWDTAGQENFRSITRSYYRSIAAAIIVYDITCRRSFEKVQGWLNELKENAHSFVSIALVGNKIDLEKNREVTYQEGYEFAKTNKLKFTETCAFELTSVVPLFTSLAEEVLGKIENETVDPTNEHLGIKMGSLAKPIVKKKNGKAANLKTTDSAKKKPCC